MTLLDNLYECWQFDGSLVGVNGKTFSISSPQFEVGKFDIGLRCTGNTDSAGAASGTTDFLTGGASWTGAMWVKLNELSSTGIKLLSDNRFPNGGGFWLTLYPTGFVQFGVKSGIPSGKLVSSSVPLIVGNWCLVIFGYDIATLKSFIRINDAQVTLGTTFTAYAGPVSPLTIGMIYLLNGGVPNAVFDTFTLWNRSLTEAEMQALWNLGAGLDYPFA